MIATYRKIPVEVVAVQWTGDNVQEIKDFVGIREDNGECQFLLPSEIFGHWDHPHVWDKLHKIWVQVMPNDFVIKGVMDEFCPCNSDVFATMYEESVRA